MAKPMMMSQKEMDKMMSYKTAMKMKSRKKKSKR